MFVKRLTLFTVVALLGTSSPAGAQSASVPAGAALQPLPAIRAAAEAAVRAQVDATLPGLEVQAAALDPRLRLAACESKLATLATAPRPNQARVPVRVSCGAPAWMVNVPVELRRSHAVLVLRRAVARGEILTAGDVTTQQRVLPGLASPYVARVEDLAGRPTRRPIPEGAALTADSLTAALLIKRGQQVTLLAQTNGFEVRAPGRAMADAGAQQRVRVQNLNSLKIVEGIADNDGTVRVTP